MAILGSMASYGVVEQLPEPTSTIALGIVFLIAVLGIAGEIGILAGLVLAIMLGIIYVIMIRMASWTSKKRTYFSDERVQKVLFLALAGPITVDAVQKELQMSREEAIHFLIGLRDAELLDVRGPANNPKFSIASEYYRKAIQKEFQAKSARQNTH